MSNFVASSNFTKMLANLFVFAVLIGAITLYVIDNISHITPPDQLTFLLGSGLGAALNLLGVHQGTSLFLANGATVSPPTSPNTVVSNITASETIDNQQTTTKLAAVGK